jgi:hypothetical protein
MNIDVNEDVSTSNITDGIENKETKVNVWIATIISSLEVFSRFLPNFTITPGIK